MKPCRAVLLGLLLLFAGTGSATELVLTAPESPSPCPPESVCTYDPNRYTTARFEGTATGASLGTALAAGDLDGDGYTELIVGAPALNGSGQIFIFYGSPSGFSDTLSTAGAVQIYAKYQGSLLGSSLTVADFDLDGVSDLAVGAPGESSSKGRVYLIMGGKRLSSESISSLSAYSLEGPSSGSQFGSTLASGTFLSDGSPDLFIGTPGSNRVALYNAPTHQVATEVFWFEGIGSSDFGRSIALTGALTRDSAPDLVIGAPIGNSGGGEVWIVNSRPLSALTTVANGNVWRLSTVSSPTAEVRRIVGDIKVDGKSTGNLGFAVSGGGDLDKDGYYDVLLGGPTLLGGTGTSVLRNAGRVYILFGSSTFYSTVTTSLSTLGTYLSGVHLDEHLGSALQAAGQLTLDSYPDFIVGAPGHTQAGMTQPTGGGYIVPGGAQSGWSTIGQSVTSRSEVGFVGGVVGEETGSTLLGGLNLGGDALDDFFVASPKYDSFGLADSGRVYLLNVTDYYDQDGDDQSVAGGDCNDLNRDVRFDADGGTETCDALDNDCDTLIDDADPSVEGKYGYYRDADGDGYGGDVSADFCSATPPVGYTTTAGDCDDTSGTIHPLATEICDGLDNDCDDKIDDDDDLEEGLARYYSDGDGDGFGAGEAREFCAAFPPPGYSSLDTDCDDSNRYISPEAEEVCDLLDNDCDELTDADDPDFSGSVTYFRDADDDAYGRSDETLKGCSSTAPDGYSREPGDCSDEDATVYPGANEGVPGAPGACISSDGKDNDCDGTIDEGTCASDDDQDGHSEDAGDCDDSDASRYPGAVESCDLIDSDCDGDPINGFDADADGFPSSCTLPDVAQDCNDSSASIYPGAAEACDGIDNSCDELIDEGFDLDGDGVVGGEACESLGDPLDCDDDDDSIYPGATERCDGFDHDCDGNNLNGFDDDEDGYAAGTGCIGEQDCDDDDASIYPGATELCDGVDQNCRDAVEDEAVDIDRDGTSSCSTSAEVPVDCDDTNSAVYPGAEEECEDMDHDCDGTLGYQSPTFDLDEDGYPDEAQCGTLSGEIPLDCDDSDQNIYPGAIESPGGSVDMNCDGELPDPVEQDTLWVDTALGCACSTGRQSPSGSSVVPLGLGALALWQVRRRRQRSRQA